MGLNSFQTSGNSPTQAGCQVDILGFGTVGSAIVRRLTGPDSLPTLHVPHICDRVAAIVPAPVLTEPKTTSGVIDQNVSSTREAV